MPPEISSNVIGRQLLRSGTSIAANIEEAQASVSRADFANKMGIALKEARETSLWLRLIERTEIVQKSIVAPLLDEVEQLKRILGSISKKVRPFSNR